jgi:hypothetical protein
MKRILLAVLAILAICLVSVGCAGKQGEQGPQGIQGPVGPQGPPGEVPVKQWHHVVTLSGWTNLNSGPYDVPGDDFRLRYYVHPDANANGEFLLAVAPPGSEPVGIVSIGPTAGATSGIEYIRDGRQQFWFSILAFGLDEWEVRVEALY